MNPRKAPECNAEVKEAIRASGLTKWQIADAIGIHHTTLSVWLRHEMVPERKEMVLAKIAEAVKKAG